MKLLHAKVFSFIIIFLMTSSLIQAQDFNLSNSESSIKVLGTSNVHDWELKSEKQTGSLVVENLDNFQLKGLNVTITTESLKSGKSGMDKNTYKALKTKSYKTINFQLAEVKKVENNGSKKFKVTTTGDLTIAGVKKRVSLDFSATVSGNTITLTGEKTLKMTDYKVDPPTALLGAISTGDEVTIKFSTIFK